MRFSEFRGIPSYYEVVLALLLFVVIGLICWASYLMTDLMIHAVIYYFRDYSAFVLSVLSAFFLGITCKILLLRRFNWRVVCTFYTFVCLLVSAGGIAIILLDTVN